MYFICTWICTQLFLEILWYGFVLANHNKNKLKHHKFGVIFRYVCANMHTYINFVAYVFVYKQIVDKFTIFVTIPWMFQSIQNTVMFVFSLETHGLLLFNNSVVFQIGFHYITQDGLKLTPIILPQHLSARIIGVYLQA